MHFLFYFFSTGDVNYGSFVSSFASLLWMTEVPEFDAICVFSLSTEVLTKLQSGSADCVSARRFVIYQKPVFFVISGG